MDEAPVIYEFAGRRLDPARRQLTHGGKPVALFPRCLDALVLLVEHRGELLDKDFLLGALWPDVVVDENSLAKVISDIRRALGETRDVGCIETVPRRGYRFTARVEVSRGDDALPVTSAGAREGIRRLAVLPLTFLNPAPEDETLSLGLADALIARFGQMRHTLVRPTTSITRYAGTSFVPTEVGRELGVDAVITGTLRRVGSTLRISVQLVSVAIDAVSWAEKFDVQGSSTLALEDSIAERVVTALTLALARDAPPPPRPHRADPDAYEHYIRARYLIAKRTRTSLQEAVACLERAIAIDPRFALAHAGLSEAWIQLGVRAAVSQSLRPRETMPKARAAAEKALALDEELSEAHGTLGQVLVVYEWNRPAGIAELLRAIELNPNNQNAQHWYAMALGSLGRFDEALVQIERALAIDPLAVIVNANVGYLLYRAGRIDEAVTKLRHTVAMEPGFAMTRYRLGSRWKRRAGTKPRWPSSRPCSRRPTTRSASRASRARARAWANGPRRVACSRNCTRSRGAPTYPRQPLPTCTWRSANTTRPWNCWSGRSKSGPFSRRGWPPSDIGTRCAPIRGSRHCCGRWGSRIRGFETRSN